MVSRAVGNAPSTCDDYGTIPTGTFPQKFTDFKKEDTEEIMSQDEEMIRYALEHDYGVKATEESIDMARLLAS